MQERASRTRRELLVAAATLFDRVGYERATLSGISRLANMTKGALSFHFTSKLELAEAVRRLACSSSRAALDGLRRPDLPPLQVTIDITHAIARQLAHDTLARAGARLSREPGGPARPDTDCYLNWLETLLESLRRAESEQCLAEGADVPTTAGLLLSATTGPHVATAARFIAAREDACYPLPADGPGDWLTAIWELLLPRLSHARELPRLRSGGTPSLLGPGRSPL